MRIALTIAATMSACVASAVGAPLRATAAPVRAPRPTTLTFCHPKGVALKMDLYRPTANAAVPVVVQVHPGAWSSGKRTTGVTPALVHAFLARGIALASVDYRLGNARRAIQDVACAVRYLREYADRLGIDRRRVGAMGQSAGGQLVSLLGTAGRAAGFDAGQYLKRSSRVEAVVDEWGPVIFDKKLLEALPVIPDVFGTADLGALAKYSPLTYLTPDDPPFLLVHGAQDDEVPATQSRRFAAALEEQGVAHRMVVVQHAGHGLVPYHGTPNPTLAQIQDDAAAFFADVLR